VTAVKQAQADCGSRRGQTTTEYAMILAAIVVVLFTLYSTAGALIDAIVNGVVPLFG
jgi:Flp pilus assembly pilin Flp